MSPVRLVITDSGLGGLSICAELARRLALRGVGARLTYVNAWPEDGCGYNDLPDMAARAAVFDRVLEALVALGPDRVAIACNTLSIVYEHTRYAAAPRVPVEGIIDAGVRLFATALAERAGASLLLLGTRATIESGAHRNRLVAAGIEPSRLAGIPCHGLATAIERDVHGPRVGDLISHCAAASGAAGLNGSPVYVGLCCTHYGYVARRLTEAIASATDRPALPLDPNTRLVDALERLPDAAPEPGPVSVEILSKIRLDDRTRAGVSSLVEPVSPVTARALEHYAHLPDLF